MWFSFGILTLLASTLWGLRVRLAAAWRGQSNRIGGNSFDVQEVRNKGHLRLVRLGTTAPAGLHFRVRAERVHDRFFKWLGITTEIQTRDAEFDQQLYVESDARAVAILLRRNATLRATLVKIFDYAQGWRMGKMRVRCANKRLWLEFSLKSESELYPAKTYLAPLLHTLASCLECLDLPAEYKRDRFVWRGAAVLAFSTGALALGAFGLTRSLAGGTDILEPRLLFFACLAPAIALTVAGAAAVLAWLISSSRAHTVVLEFVLVGGLGFVLGGYALAREADMEFDSHPASPVVVDVSVDHRVSRGGRNSTHHSYYVYCADWRSGHEGQRLSIEITSSTYQRLQGRSSAAIYVRPGSLGFDWIERIEPISASQSP
jgi:hypothetical protein